MRFIVFYYWSFINLFIVLNHARTNLRKIETFDRDIFSYVISCRNVIPRWSLLHQLTSHYITTPVSQFADCESH